MAKQGEALTGGTTQGRVTIPDPVLLAGVVMMSREHMAYACLYLMHLVLLEAHRRNHRRRMQGHRMQVQSCRWTPRAFNQAEVGVGVGLVQELAESLQALEAAEL